MSRAKKFTIEINCEGASLQCDPDALGNILRKVAEKVDTYCLDVPVTGRIMDENGNHVGYYKRVHEE